MKIKSVILNSLLAVALIGATLAQAASSTTYVLTTGEPGVGGLNFDAPNVVAARHFGNDTAAYTVQGVSFANNHAGINGRPQSTYFTVTTTTFNDFEADFLHPSPNPITGTANDNALGTMCTSMYYGSDNPGAGGGFNFRISSLAPYSTNLIEIIHYLGTGFGGARNTTITITNGDGSGTLPR